jgi:NADH-quinone oxidoreductase subunit N
MSDHITSAILFYLLVYLFMNLGAFMVAAVIAEREGTEDVRDYAGMLRRSPMLCLMMVVFLLSLFGMPGLGGFLGKIMLGTAMAKAGFGGLVLIVVLLINTLISFAFYVRPIYIMTFQSGDETRPVFVPRPAVVAVLSTCTLALVLTGIHLVGATDLTRTFATIQGPPAPHVEPLDEAAE